jgi:hypothetical protein
MPRVDAAVVGERMASAPREKRVVVRSRPMWRQVEGGRRLLGKDIALSKVFGGFWEIGSCELCEGLVRRWDVDRAVMKTVAEMLVEE